MNEPELSPSDHTKIMEVLISNRRELMPYMRGAYPTSVLLQKAAKLSPPDQEATFSVAAQRVREYNESALDLDLGHKLWVEAKPILISLGLFQGNTKELLAELKSHSANSSEPIRIGLNYARDIVSDGASTIYNPEYWVEYDIMPADVFWYDLRQGAADALERGKAILVDDLIGAVKGAVKGAIESGQQGAKKGAITGAIDGSTGSA